MPLAGASMITHDSLPEMRDLGMGIRDDGTGSLSESLAVMQHQEATPCAKPCIAPPAIERSDWNRLLEIWTEIGPNARAALMMIGERLRVGRKVYDDDFTDDRDWDQMALEEDLDGCVYRAVKKVKEIHGR